MPTEEIAKAAFACGSVSGRDTDKVRKFNIEMMQIPGNTIQVPLHSCMAIECTLSETVDVGDHYFYVCTVENFLGDLSKKALFAWDEKTMTLRTAQ